MWNLCLITFLSFTVVSTMVPKEKFIMTEDYVCTVKKSCVNCLKLSQCSWCPTNNSCFSKKLTKVENFCPNSTVDHNDYGLSIEENAKCSCSHEVEQRCNPPGVTTGPECSGRGSCVCGQCLCNIVADPDEPTKMVMGEFCEFDNFSCEGPKCNEGPYSISGPMVAEDVRTTSASAADIDIPTS